MQFTVHTHTLESLQAITEIPVFSVFVCRYSVFLVFWILISVSLSVFQNIPYRFGVIIWAYLVSYKTNLCNCVHILLRRTRSAKSCRSASPATAQTYRCAGSLRRFATKWRHYIESRCAAWVSAIKLVVINNTKQPTSFRRRPSCFIRQHPQTGCTVRHLGRCENCTDSLCYRF